MGYIDLHVHSNASDGTLSPAQVVELAAREGLKAIALTDHDTVAGIREAKEAAARSDVELVPGIEFSCVWKGTEIHILGLFVDLEDPSFCREVDALKAVRDERNTEMIRRFQADGMDITLEGLKAGKPDTVITRAHVARLLVEKGYAPTLDGAFKKYLQYGGRYCIRKERIDPEKAIEILVKDHAFPSLAHIMQYKLGWEEDRKLVAYLKELGLQGLEVYHSSHNASQSIRLQDLAVRYGLLPTGGSDFHGANKPDIQIGVGRGGLKLSYGLLEDIKRARG